MKHKNLLMTAIAIFGLAIITSAQSIIFSPSNPSLCGVQSISISAELVTTPSPALNFPYTKLTGSEIYVSTSGSNTTGNGTFSNPYQTIQRGINNAVNGQIVTILPGTYSGSGNVNISTQGKQIIVQSEQGPINTIIDCALNGRGFLINQGETMTTVIKGLSIMNGKTNAAPLLYGSGIFVEDNSGIKIVDCFFINNQEGCIQFGDNEVSGHQSGIENCSFISNLNSCIGASKKSFYTESCFFYNNSTTGELFGNGHMENPSQYYQNCVFKCNQGNIIGGLGHGKILNNSLFISNTTAQGIIYMGTNWSGTNTIDHCTFYNNTCNYYNSSWSDHTGQVLSSIFYPGDARSHVSGNQGSIPFSFSLGNNILGSGNIQGNPLFINPSNYNFNLDVASPCIGTGASGSNMGADMNLIPSWMFNFLEHYSGSFNNILWENGQTTDTVTLSISQSQYVSVQFTDCGATYTDSVWVEFNQQPTQPITACYETATFNSTTCQWDVTGTQPTQPTTACYETATFNPTICQWVVTGSQPTQPTTACYETATFNPTTCQWVVTGAQPTISQPTNQIININNNAQFVVSSSDPSASYQWQTDLGVGFQNLNSVGQYNGTTNDTLTISNVTMSNNNQPFRCIVSSGSCSDTSNIAVLTVNNNIGLNETSQDNLFSVYPNPAKSLINVKADSKLIGEVYKIYDNSGRVVFSGKLDSQNSTIELGNLSGGIYMFSVGENMKQAFKVIKE
jgi:hypothetical protein